MTFTIEPMIAWAPGSSEMWDDDWTAVTVDGRRSAQFEHTIVGHRGRRRDPHPPPRRSLVWRLRQDWGELAVSVSSQAEAADRFEVGGDHGVLGRDVHIAGHPLQGAVVVDRRPPPAV